MRDIKLIVIHCTATRAGHPVTAAQINDWHIARGFKSIGYHFVIGLNGELEFGRGIDEVGAHVRGFNSSSIGIAYVGGLDANGNPADTRTPEQKAALMRVLSYLKKEFPEARILGHNDLNIRKACPCFNAAKEYEDL